MVIQASLDAAVHAQPATVVTFTPLVPPLAVKLRVVGLMVNEQPELWVTVNVWPATVIVPVLCGPAWAATEKDTAPLPEPLAPELIVIQESLLDAVQTHPVAVVTLTPPVPPEAVKP
jgi:hypothetical protein